MVNAKVWIGRVLACAIMLGMAWPAAATQVSLWNASTGGGILSVGAITYSVTACSLTLNGVAQTNCNGTHYVLETTATANQIEIAGDASAAAKASGYEGAAGTDIFNISDNLGLYDLKVTLSVTSSLSSSLISSVQAALTGAFSSNNVKKASTAPTLADYVPSTSSTPLFTPIDLSSLGGTNLSGTITSAATAVGPYSIKSSPLVMSIDLRIASNTGNHPGETLILSNTTQRFAPVPEPAAIGAFLLALGCLAIARRRRGCVDC